MGSPNLESKLSFFPPVKRWDLGMGGQVYLGNLWEKPYGHGCLLEVLGGGKTDSEVKEFLSPLCQNLGVLSWSSSMGSLKIDGQFGKCRLCFYEASYGFKNV